MHVETSLSFSTVLGSAAVMQVLGSRYASQAAETSLISCSITMNELSEVSQLFRVVYLSCDAFTLLLLRIVFSTRVDDDTPAGLPTVMPRGTVTPVPHVECKIFAWW